LTLLHDKAALMAAEAGMTEPPRKSTPKHQERVHFRPDIQGLRAIAVVSVMIFHFFPAKVLPGGFVGVDIFFVISGFLISASILKEIEAKQFSLVQFYARRIRRLYPALIIVIAVSAIAGWRFIFPTQFIGFGREILSAVLFAANINFYLNSGYFQAQTDSLPLLHLWSLGVEEQFYFFFPFLCLVGRPSKKRMAVLFFAAAIISMAINLTAVKNDPSFDFYMPVTRFWEFFAGIFLAFCEPYFVQHFRRAKYARPVAELASVLGIILLVFSVFHIKASFEFPGYWAIFPCLGAALLIFAGGVTVINKWLLSNPLAVFLGMISYPLYLWHWPILVFIQIATFSTHVTPAVRFSMVLASVILATLTYYLVEQPLHGLARGSRKNIFALSYVAVFAVLGLFGLSAIPAHGFPTRFTAEMRSIDHNYGADAGSDYGHCFLAQSESPSHYGADCANVNHIAAPIRTVFLWGDSHAADLLGGFAGVLTPKAVRIAQYTSSLCAPIVNRDTPGRPLCRAANDAILAKLRAQKPDIVVLSALWPTDADSYVELGQTIKLIKSAGVSQVVIIGPAPLWNVAVIAVLEGQLRRNPNAVLSNDLRAADMDSSQMDEPGLKTASEAAGARYISLLSILCSGQGCLVKTGSGWQNIVTFDTAHFTAHGSRYVADRIVPQILAP
jgi:peptidoglycan/LPS O-acetylase OafA/YrhL